MTEKKPTKTKRKPGRPRKNSYAVIFAEMENPPIGDPMAVCIWAQRICAMAMHETIQGRGNRELNQEIRSFTSAIIKAVPTERLIEAEKKITRASRRRRKPQVAQGPEVRTVATRSPGESKPPTLRG